MYTIRTLNNIAKTGLAKLPEQNFVIEKQKILRASSCAALICTRWS